MKRKMSLRVIRRISFYYEGLLKLGLPDDSYISSKKLEDITGISCNQIRQDFFYLGISIGKQKKGYQVKKLHDELRDTLSIDSLAEVIVIGAGRLGLALSEYRLFKARNIHVRALFDIKPELVGTNVDIKGEKIAIHHVDQLEDYLKEHKETRICILAVPEHAAQGLLDRLINFGIEGIVNYAPTVLKLPPNAGNVQLANECIGAALYKIVYQLQT